MSAPEPTVVKACPECGALASQGATCCWLCRRDFGPADAAAEQAPAPEQQPIALAEGIQPVEGGLAPGPLAYYGPPPGGGSPFVGGRPGIYYHRRAAFQFSLATVMLLITLAAVLLGLFRMSPGLGMLVAVLVAPALIRTLIESAERQALGRPMTPADKASMFASTVGLTIAMGVAVIVVGGLALATAVFVICSVFR